MTGLASAVKFYFSFNIHRHSECLSARINGVVLSLRWLRGEGSIQKLFI